MRYSRLPLTDIVRHCLSQGKEGEFWDFKQEWHIKTEDLIKDIICFANTVHDENCYLIFGVADDLSVVGVNGNRRKQADILDTLSNMKFAGDNIPQISVDTLFYGGVELDILIVYNTDKTPLYLKDDYKLVMKKGCIYSRIGDRNTPNNGNAEVEVIANLWRKRFGLTKPPLDYIFDSLKNKLEWTESENGYYNIYRPELSIERAEDDDDSISASRLEFYSYAMVNEATSYYQLDIKANGTTLESFQIVSLDSGRLSVPVPEWGFIPQDSYHQTKITYKYYIFGSYIDKLLRFLYDSENKDQESAFNNLEQVTLFFDSLEEKVAFDDYVKQNHLELQRRVMVSNKYDYIRATNDLQTIEYKKNLRTGLVLNEMLIEFRALKIKPLRSNPMLHKCIYCLQEKEECEFNKEHVVPRMMGRYTDALVLSEYQVCQECNSYFSKEIENLISLDSYEAFLRMKSGNKKMSDGRTLKTNRFTITGTGGSFKGLNFVPEASSSTPGRIRFVIQPCIGIINPDGTYAYYDLDDVPSITEEKQLELKQHDTPIVQIGYEEAEVTRVLCEKGYWTDKSTYTEIGIDDLYQLPTFDVSLSIKIDSLVRRLCAKTIFNYLCYNSSVDEMLDPRYDKLRKYVRFGEWDDDLWFRYSKGYITAAQPPNSTSHVVGTMLFYNKGTWELVGCITWFGEITYIMKIYNISTLRSIWPNTVVLPETNTKFTYFNNETSEITEEEAYYFFGDRR